MRIRWIYHHYCDMNPIRNLEVASAVAANAKLEWLDLCPMKERPTFAEMFRFANLMQRYSMGDDISIISNTDMVFDETMLLCTNMDHSECYALTRYDDTNDAGFFVEDKNTIISQDTWVFKGPINVAAMDVDFLNGMGCSDWRVAYEIVKAGYFISNPSLSIKTCHHHKCNRRSWPASAGIKGPYHHTGLEAIKLPERI